MEHYLDCVRAVICAEQNRRLIAVQHEWTRFGYRTGSEPDGGSNSWPVQCTAPLLVKAQ